MQRNVGSRLIGFAFTIGWMIGTLPTALPAQDTAPPPAEISADEKPAVIDEDAPARSLTEKASFLIGYQFHQNLKRQGVEVDLSQVIKGLQRSASNQPAGMELEEIEAIQAAFNREVVKRRKALFEQLAAENAAKGEAFLVANAKAEGVQSIENGVQYSVITAGTGESPLPADTVVVHYRGMLIDGTEFTATKKDEPANLVVSSQIPGFVAIVQKMKVGAKWKVVIPSALAFGLNGTRAVGPNETLIYELELVGIVKN